MKWLFWIFAVLYALALLLFLVGNFGWFGQERDPLAGIFLLPLGLPWSWLGGRMGLAGVAVGVLSPLVNLAILYWLWKRKRAA
jgi:hypothetical protein